MLRLFDNLKSGNAYKVRLLLHQLAIPFESIDLDIFAGETRTDEFLAINPNGRVPALQLEDGTCLPESNAILWYLADGTNFVPEDRLGRAQVLQWQFFEQYNHEPSIAVAHAIRLYFPDDAERQALLPGLMEKGHKALEVMESHLKMRDWFVGQRYSIADISLYAYTHFAGETGFEMGRFPATGAWLKRCAAEPGHVPITWHP